MTETTGFSTERMSSLEKTEGFLYNRGNDSEELRSTEPSTCTARLLPASAGRIVRVIRSQRPGRLQITMSETLELNTETELDPVQMVKQFIYGKMELQQLQEGDRLPSEIALSQYLGIPRNNVREALQSLKGIGLLSSVRGSGYMLSPDFDNSLSEILRAMMAVSDISKKDINEVRQALDRRALEVILRNAAAEDRFTVLEQQVRIMEENCLLAGRERMNSLACVEADKEFHRQLAILSGNTFIRAFSISLSHYYEGFEAMQWEVLSLHETEELMNCHWNMIQALKLRQPEQCYEELDRHYRFTEAALQHIVHSETQDMKELQLLIDRLHKKGFSAKQLQEKLLELV